MEGCHELEATLDLFKGDTERRTNLKGAGAHPVSVTNDGPSFISERFQDRLREMFTNARI